MCTCPQATAKPTKKSSHLEIHGGKQKATHEIELDSGHHQYFGFLHRHPVKGGLIVGGLATTLLALLLFIRRRRQAHLNDVYRITLEGGDNRMESMTSHHQV